VPLNVDLDVALSVLASAGCAALRRPLPGQATGTPDTLQRHFLGISGQILNHGQVTTIAATGAPTHPSSALPTCPPSPSSVGKAAPSATNSPETGGNSLRGRVERWRGGIDR